MGGEREWETVSFDCEELFGVLFVGKFGDKVVFGGVWGILLLG